MLVKRKKYGKNGRTQCFRYEVSRTGVHQVNMQTEMCGARSRLTTATIFKSVQKKFTSIESVAVKTFLFVICFVSQFLGQTIKHQQAKFVRSRIRSPPMAIRHTLVISVLLLPPAVLAICLYSAFFFCLYFSYPFVFAARLRVVLNANYYLAVCK